MDGEFIVIHLRKHRVQMHERARPWNLEGENRCDVALFIGKNVLCQLLDGLGLRPLGHADGKDAFAQVQNVAALNRKVLLRRIVKWDLPGEVRVVP